MVTCTLCGFKTDAWKDYLATGHGPNDCPNRKPLNLDAFTGEDWEELRDGLEIDLTPESKLDDAIAATLTVMTKLDALREGFYGNDRLVKDWIEHMKELRDKLRAVIREARAVSA